MDRNSVAFIVGLDSEIAKLNSRIAGLETMREVIEARPEDFTRLVEQAFRVWGPDLAWSWLCRPQMRYGEMTPLDMVVAGRETEISDFLTAVDYGVYV